MYNSVDTGGILVFLRREIGRRLAQSRVSQRVSKSPTWCERKSWQFFLCVVCQIYVYLYIYTSEASFGLRLGQKLCVGGSQNIRGLRYTIYIQLPHILSAILPFALFASITLRISLSRNSYPCLAPYHLSLYFSCCPFTR